MKSHLESHHRGTWNLRQLPVLLEMSERQIDDSSLTGCPLCPFEDQLGRLRVHLAEHMEDLSLFALATTEKETSPKEGDADSDAVRGFDYQSRYLSGDHDINQQPITIQNEDANGLFKQPMGQNDPGHIVKVDSDRSIASNEAIISPESRPQLKSVAVNDGNLDSSLTDGGLFSLSTFICDLCGRAFDQIHKLK
jgi:hypothetical protein